MFSELERLEVPLSSIAKSRNYGPLDQKWVDALADSIVEVGLTVPLVVSPAQDDSLRLRAGAHRLAARQKLGLATIAVVREGARAPGPSSHISSTHPIAQPSANPP